MVFIWFPGQTVQLLLPMLLDFCELISSSSNAVPIYVAATAATDASLNSVNRIVPILFVP
jgi:hypothetical protein